MGVLESNPTYKDKVRFIVVPNSSPSFADGVAKYSLGTHGLVGLDSKGELVEKILGHNFKTPEILAIVAKLTS